MGVDMLFPYLMDFSKPCHSCSHFYKHMKQSEVARIIEHHYKESGVKLQYELGQKICIKQNEFVYFNWNCNNYLKR